LNNLFNLTLQQYIKKRNGVPIGADKSLRNMLYRSIGARNFATFWMYWNPIFGYYLGIFIFKPLRKFTPAPFAQLATFIVCGLIHDCVTMVVRRDLSFFFSQWFLLMGLWVLYTSYSKHDFSNHVWLIRAILNSLPVILTFLIVTYLTNFFWIYS
jgi:hypothetical protein